MQSFWDLDFALKCVQGGQPHVAKLRKPEAVAALRALVWFVTHIPGAQALLQEVRSLAGRRLDGLDKGTVNHAQQALQEQAGIRPYSYTAALRAAGVPQAPPPGPGQHPAHSFVPAASLPRTSLRRAVGEGATRAATATAEAREASEAAAALLADSQGPETQQVAGGDAGAVGKEMAAAAAALAEDSQSVLNMQASEEDSMLFSGLGTLSDGVASLGPDGDGDGGGADEGNRDESLKVSDPDDASNHVLNSNVSVLAVPRQGGGLGAVPRIGGGLGAVPQGGGGLYVRTPAEAGPLVADGVTVGRNEVGHSQVQEGSQAVDSAGRIRPKRSQVCLEVRRGSFCMDKDCAKAHPAVCGDPQCFPRWRRACPLWHVRARGNGSSADPGRASSGQSQGTAQGATRRLRQPRRRDFQQQRRRQQQQQQRPRQQWQERQQQQPPWRRPQPWRLEPQAAQRPTPAPPHPLPFPRPLFQDQAPLQQQSQHRQQQHPQLQQPRQDGMSYRDAVIRGGGAGSDLLSPGLLLGRLEALEARLQAGLAGLMAMSSGC